MGRGTVSRQRPRNSADCGGQGSAPGLLHAEASRGKICSRRSCRSDREWEDSINSSGQGQAAAREKGTGGRYSERTDNRVGVGRCLPRVRGRSGRHLSGRQGQEARGSAGPRVGGKNRDAARRSYARPNGGRIRKDPKGG